MSKDSDSNYSSISAAIKQIASDNRSGASEILSRAAEVFALLDQIEKSITGVEDARHIVLSTCVALMQAQPEMAPISNLASAVAQAVIAQVTSSADELMKVAAEAARGFAQWAEQAAACVSSHAADLISDRATVLTHSRSSTVLAAFRKVLYSGRHFSVIATESRPMFEGRALAEMLARDSVSVTVIADAAAALAMGRVDLVLLGADKVTPDYLLNKIGTRMIALAARERSCPVYALCDTSKFINAAATNVTNDERRSSDEVWPDAPPGVAVLNHYFEPTPLAHFTKIITESGAITPDEAARRADASPLNQALLRAISGK